MAVLPADTPLLPRLRSAVPASARIVTFGASPAADVRLIQLDMDSDGSEVTAELFGERVVFRLNAPGRHMAMNALAALAATLDVAHLASEALVGFAPMVGRGARRRIPVAGGTALLLDESYNGNPASMRAALAVLRLQPAKQRIAVLGDMLELGDVAPAEHRALAAVAAAAADRVFTCGPLMRGLHDALPDGVRGEHAADSAAIAPIVARAIADGDTILIKGSLGSRMKLVVNALEPRAEAA